MSSHLNNIWKSIKTLFCNSQNAFSMDRLFMLQNMLDIMIILKFRKNLTTSSTGLLRTQSRSLNEIHQVQ